MSEDQLREAREAVRRAENREQESRAARREVLGVIKEVREFQRRNHFSAAIRNALGGAEADHG